MLISILISLISVSFANVTINGVSVKASDNYYRAVIKKTSAYRVIVEPKSQDNNVSVERYLSNQQLFGYERLLSTLVEQKIHDGQSVYKTHEPEVTRSIFRDIIGRSFLKPTVADSFSIYQIAGSVLSTTRDTTEVETELARDIRAEIRRVDGGDVFIYTTADSRQIEFIKSVIKNKLSDVSTKGIVIVGEITEELMREHLISLARNEGGRISTEADILFAVPNEKKDQRSLPELLAQLSGVKKYRVKLFGGNIDSGVELISALFRSKVKKIPVEPNFKVRPSLEVSSARFESEVTAAGLIKYLYDGGIFELVGLKSQVTVRGSHTYYAHNNALKIMSTAANSYLIHLRDVHFKAQKRVALIPPIENKAAHLEDVGEFERFILRTTQNMYDFNEELKSQLGRPFLTCQGLF